MHSKLSRILVSLTLPLIGMWVFAIASQQNLAVANETQITEQIQPQYMTATLLLERKADGTLVELTPVSSNWRFKAFTLATHETSKTLWLNNSYEQAGQRQGVEQHLTSTDGIVWENRTNTNLTDSTLDYHYPYGIREVILDDEGVYHGWHNRYYYQTGSMWTVGIRYITSTNGINWSIVTDPILTSGSFPSFVKEGNLYHSWIRTAGDSNYAPTHKLRYRVTATPDSGFGHWETGGVAVTVNGQDVTGHSRVRQQEDGTYQLFYRHSADEWQIALAESNDGITFTSVYTNLVNYSEILPDYHTMYDFEVVSQDDGDWFYFAYLDTDLNAHMAVVRPEASNPIAKFNVAPQDSSEPYKVTFINQSENSSGYVWSFGDGVTSTESNPLHEYESPGEYMVTLTAVNDNGEATASAEVYIYPKYSQSDILIEEKADGTQVELGPEIPDWRFRAFTLNNQANHMTHTLWLNSSHTPAGQRQGVEQRLVSDDGLIWKSRTNTNIVDNTLDYHYPTGLREVFIDENGVYHGWHNQYYYYTSGMWTPGIRYITSTDGLNWQVVTNPILTSGSTYNFIKNENDIYESWIQVVGDTNFSGARHLRYRTSNGPDGSLSHWQTGGTAVTVDGNEVFHQNRVRKLDNGRYELFYRPTDQPYIGIATSTDGITFTSVYTDLVRYEDVISDFYVLYDFDVHEIEEESWFYVTYIDTDTNTHIAVIRPELTEPKLSVDPDALTFTTSWETAPSTQSITISNAGGGDLSWEAVTEDSWLNLDRSQGVGNTQLSVSIDVAGLEVGSHYSKISITPNGITTDTVEIPVTLHIKPDASLELTAEGGYGAIDLNWTLHNDINVTKYRVKRQGVDENTFTQISLLYKTRLFDARALTSGGEYCYFVEALDSNQKVVAQSNIDCAIMGESTLWVPNISAPAGQNVFIPVNIANSQGLRIAASDIWIEYDSTVINPVGISATPLTQGYTWSYSVENTDDSDIKRIRISAFSSDPRQLYGEGSLFWLEFNVLGESGDESDVDLKDFVAAVGGSTIYTPDDLFNTIPLNLEDGRVEITDGYGLGDVNGNSVIEAVDAYLALQISLGKSEATADQIRAGDINGNGTIDIGDATMIFYHAVHGKWPSTSSSRSIATPTTGIDLSLGTAVGQAGDRVQVDLNISNATDMSSGQFTLFYDPSAISDIVTVRLGDIATGFTLDYYDNGQGVLQIGLLDDSTINENGTLVTIEVELASQLSDGASTSVVFGDAHLADLVGRDFETSAIQATINQESNIITIGSSGAYIYLPMVTGPSD